MNASFPLQFFCNLLVSISGTSGLYLGHGQIKA